MYRNKKLLAHANGAPCQYCGIQDGTVVAAHSNQLRDGKGVGFKSSDFRTAFLCFTCHNFCDGRDGNLSRQERIDLWEQAHRNTIGYLFDSGIIGVIK